MEPIRVICGTSFNRHTTDPIDPSTTTLRSILDQYQVNYMSGQTNLNGTILSAADLDKTFADCGVTEGSCYLLNVAKQDNA